MFNGYEWQGYKLEVSEGRSVESSVVTTSRPSISAESISRDNVLPPTLNQRSPSITEISFKTEPGSYPAAITPPIAAIPTPISTVDPVPPQYQNMYRYGEAAAPPPPHLPPPPPMYTHMSLVGGPAANLPTHGHNQIFVNNVII